MTMRRTHTRFALTAIAATALTVTMAFPVASAQGQAGGQGQGQTQGQTQGRQGQGPGQRGAGQGGGRQGRDLTQQQTTPGTGSISGYVTVDGSSGAVRRARVDITAPEVRPARMTVTDDK